MLDTSWSAIREIFSEARFLNLTASPLLSDTFEPNKALGTVLADFPRIKTQDSYTITEQIAPYRSQMHTYEPCITPYEVTHIPLYPLDLMMMSEKEKAVELSKKDYVDRILNADLGNAVIICGDSIGHCKKLKRELNKANLEKEIAKFLNNPALSPIAKRLNKFLPNLFDSIYRGNFEKNFNKNLKEELDRCKESLNKSLELNVSSKSLDGVFNELEKVIHNNYKIADVIHYGKDKEVSEEMKQIIKDFKTGTSSTRFLINLRMIGEGFDCPKVSGVVILRNLYKLNSIKDAPQMIERDQIIGRACRTYTNNQGISKEIAKVLELVPENMEFPSPLPMSMQEFGKHRIATNEQIGFIGYSLSRWKDKNGTSLTLNNIKCVKGLEFLGDKIDAIWENPNPEESQKGLINLLAKNNRDLGDLAYCLAKAGYTHNKVNNEIVLSDDFKSRIRGEINPNVVYALLNFKNNGCFFDFDDIKLEKEEFTIKKLVGDYWKEKRLQVCKTQVSRRDMRFSFYSEANKVFHADFGASMPKGTLTTDDIYKIASIKDAEEKFKKLAGVSPTIDRYTQYVCHKDYGFQLYKKYKKLYDTNDADTVKDISQYELLNLYLVHKAEVKDVQAKFERFKPKTSIQF